MTPYRKKTGIVLMPAVLVSLLLSACDRSGDHEPIRNGVNTFIDLSLGQEPVCGNLRVDFIDANGDSVDGASGPAYVSTFRRNAGYEGMEDNDIRGFLDGMYKEGWNQVSQSHVRLGRRGKNLAFGEYELFRNLQRWADLPVPQTAVVEDATIELSLESGPTFPVDIAIYAVRKDWNPGTGGVNNDNNGPPKNGEVWWLAAKHGQLAWGRPGAGYASDHDPSADTWAEPLAVSSYTPDAPANVSFSSRRLTEYINTQVRAGRPILLLYKLTDVYEDSPGSILEIWSANASTDGSERRPALQLRWRTTLPAVGIESPVALEAGRYKILKNLSIGGDRMAVTLFSADPSLLAKGPSNGCSGRPFIEYRPAGSDESWGELTTLHTVVDKTIDLRVSATVRPVPLGQPFEVEIRDTWILKGAPEDHAVVFEFQSPNGNRISINTDYVGDFRWRAAFVPDVLGRWAYQWRHALSGYEIIGEERRFDVVAWEHGYVIDGLKALEQAVVASGATPKSYPMLQHELSFMRLERAAMQLADTEMSGSDSQDLLELMRQIRALLSGKPVPSTLVPKPIKSRDANPDG